MSETATRAPELSTEERATVRRFDFAPEATALDEGHDFIQAGWLRMLDRFEFQADSWSKPRALECWTYPHWGIVHREIEFEARRILATGKASLEPPFLVAMPFDLWLKVVAR
jgi:hypothetical protein